MIGQNFKKIIRKYPRTDGSNNSETESSKEISQNRNEKIISPLPYMEISVCTRCVFKSYLQATLIRGNRAVYSRKIIRTYL